MSLIKEFAIEPRVMATWQHFRELWEDFGAGQGRLISKYPVLWKSKVDELARQFSKPVQAAAISAKIRREEHKFLVTGRTYNGAEGWLVNALTQMATQPFHAVIASENPAGAKEVLVAGEFDKDEPPYKVVTEDFVPRKARDLAGCAWLLVEHCEELQFIDPHFDPSEPRFRNTFEAMLQLCNAGSLKILEIHREKPIPFSPGIQEAKYRRQLEFLVPASATLRVFFWSQNPGGLGLHPRFLLTDLGGIHFENGLDEGDAGEATLVKPLTHEVWQKCREFYSKTSAAFTLAPDCIVDVA
ncbi:MAG: hypothetical protein NT154_31575, partial [Verrucomicrobia bacterium]|nr:hypothetical protein [Verrucomicrobiota bacterium]